MPIKDEIGVSDIVYFLHKYDKKSLAVDNAIENRAHNAKSVIREKEEALQELEEAINKYIDGRIMKYMKRENDH